jgi:hypothetical protein
LSIKFFEVAKGLYRFSKNQIVVLHKQLIDLQGRDELGIGEETKAVKKNLEALLDQLNLM